MGDLLSPLNRVPLAGLMLIVALGFALGRVRVKGFFLGPAGGTLFVAILGGALGLRFEELYGTAHPQLTLGALGFALFLYSVGFEAGPRFFRSLFGGTGWRFVLAGSLVVVFATASAILAARLFGLTPSISAGLLAGALTSAPTYAAAAELGRNAAALSVAFALTYPFGLVGVVLLVEFLPRLMRDDLSAEGPAAVAPATHRAAGAGPELQRAFEVRRPEIFGKTLAELALPRSTGCYVTRIHHGAEVVFPEATTALHEGDHVMAKGRVEELERFATTVGPEVYDEDLRSRLPAPRRITVLASGPIGRTLAELDFGRRLGALVTAIDRGGVLVEPDAQVMLERGDVLEVSGPRAATRAVAEEVGRFEHPTHETDVAIYAAGIFLGLLIGTIHFDIAGLDLRIGSATGLLLAGVVLGRFQKIGPFTAHVPLAARQLVRDLGILLFIAETGVQAGGGTFASISGNVLPILLAGAFTTVVPVSLTVLLARYALRLRPVDAWGSTCGGMSSTAALVALRSASEGNEHAIAYTAAFAVGSILVTLAGPIVILLTT